MAQDHVRQNDAFVVSTDNWDGYPANRTRLLKRIQETQVSNPVVFSGDMHSFFANNLRVDFDDPNSPVVATEFVGTSISAHGPPHALMAQALRQRSRGRLRVWPAALPKRRQHRLNRGSPSFLMLAQTSTSACWAVAQINTRAASQAAYSRAHTHSTWGHRRIQSTAERRNIRRNLAARIRRNMAARIRRNMAARIRRNMAARIRRSRGKGRSRRLGQAQEKAS
jgi:hypothetical protein